MKKISILVLVVTLVLTSCNSYNKLLKSTDYELKLRKAKEYYDKEYYIRSSQLYEELMPVVKGTDKAEEVYYYYTWSEYNLGDYILSQYHFKNYTRQFPNGKHVEECYYMNAFCYFLNSPNYKLDQSYTKNAIKEFQSFIDFYPESSRMDSCNLLIDQLRSKLEKKEYEITKQYYKLGTWKAAIVASKNFIKEYPSSNYNEEMYYMIIDSYYTLAINSIYSKKEERLNGAIENYVKFLDLYPKSSYISRSESIYNSSKRLKDNLN
ncbi:outer membrane protein assembly factor BamD [Sphingobacteriaceae bacterium]|nr:outer membrane protein assembly factor BamD [Sphingobacteriaceae bacterium]